ncbi:CU044_5270 family protein, partial [Actinomadura sp. HBU206391]|uniref:CU044_5270 family protein n=1 Tax=Actinomadura sp. HBU206391 TaxID=2731692 RepID=UPI00164F0BA9
RSPWQMYDQLDRLPTETGALLAEVYTRSGGHAGIDRDDRAFTYIMTTFRDATIVPPQVQAALYRVLARIPGVRIVQNVEDQAGRRGIAVARESDDLRSELLLDATTYRFLGERTVVARDKTITPRPYPTPRRWRGNWPPGPSPEPDVLTAGRVLNSTTRLETGVVDRPGRRP